MLNTAILPLVALYFINSIFCIYIGINIFNLRDFARNRLFLGVAMFGAALWSLFNAFQIMATNFHLAWVFSNLQYLSISSLPVLFSLFTNSLRKKFFFKNSQYRLYLGLIWIIPIITICLVWTDPWLGLVHNHIEFKNQGSLFFISKQYGPWFFVHTAYSYLVLTIPALLWLVSGISKPKSYGKNGIYIVFSMIVPLAANIIYFLPTGIPSCIDLTPFGYAFMGLVLYICMSRFGFLSVLPVAREKLMDNLTLPIMVFNSDNQLVFANNACELNWGIKCSNRPLSLSELLKTYPQFPWKGLEEPVIEFINNDSKIFWAIEKISLSENSNTGGKIFIGKNITANVTYTKKIEDFNRQLENKVQERTLSLSKAHARIKEELDYRKELETQMFYFTLHDPLTGAANRSLLLNHLNQNLQQFKRNPDKRVGLMIINFQNFYLLNENHGHSWGDTFLKIEAQRLLRTIRSIDLVSRYSKDIFLIMIADISDELELYEVAVRLKTLVEQPVKIEKEILSPMVKMGIVINSELHQSGEELIGDVEIALDKNVTYEQERITIFKNEYRDIKTRRRKLMEDMPKGLINKEFFLIFQPIVELQTDKVLGFEVLTRWRHPEQGLIPPSEFIPLAEKSNNLIVPLGLWIFREAVSSIKELAHTIEIDRGLYLSINVSPEQLRSPNFTEIIKGFILDSGLTANHFSIEITETSLIENIETILPILQEIKKFGIGIKLDDFGTGYASLQYLQNLPIDTIKIDQGFIYSLTNKRNQEQTRRSESIVKSLISLGKEIGVQVIAEGVETNLEKEALKNINCPQGQGYVFSEGLLSHELAAYINKEPSHEGNITKEII